MLPLLPPPRPAGAAIASVVPVRRYKTRENAVAELGDGH